jgi:hypothetical protein
MKNLLLFTTALLLVCAASRANADTVTYSVVIDTSSQAGNNGYVDFELNAGTFGAQDITANVTDFSGATLNPSDPNNDAIGTTGSLPGPLSFDNQIGNDYFEALEFGNQVSFDVTLSGAGVSAGVSSMSASGTIFQVAFTDSTMSNFLFTTDPSGTVAEIQTAADGTLSTTTQPGAQVVQIPVAATPEPSTLSLIGLGAGLIAMASHRKRHVNGSIC